MTVTNEAVGNRRWDIFGGDILLARPLDSSFFPSSLQLQNSDQQSCQAIVKILDKLFVSTML